MKWLASLITDFFITHHINQIVLFICREQGSWSLTKQLSEKGLSVSFPSWDINITTLTISSSGSALLGGVLDSSCSQERDQPRIVINNKAIQWLYLSADYPADLPVMHEDMTVTIAIVTHYPLVPLYCIKSQNGLEMAEGYWDPDFGIHLSSREVYHLQGVVLNVTAVSPFMAHLNRQKYDSCILQLLMETLHFRQHVVESQGRFRKSSDLWILQQLMNGQADISASSILVTYDRLGFAEYTIAVENFMPQLFYKIQSVRSARNIYVLPFAGSVWVTLGSIVLAITLALTFILRHESHLQDTIQSKWELSEVLLVTVGAACQQGAARNPTTSAARTLFIVLFALTVLTYTAYSASIISLLSSPSSVTTTLHNILHHGSSMGFALLNIHYYHSIFKNEDNAVSRELHQTVASPPFLELADGLESTVKGELAFCADEVEAHTYLHYSHQKQETLCSVGEIKLLQGPPYQRSFALALNTQYTKTINYGVIRLIQFGLLVREKRKWFEIRPLCDTSEPPPESSYVSIELNDIYPVLYLISAGIICAAVVEQLESAFHFCMRVRRKNAFRNLWFKQQRQHHRRQSVWWVSAAQRRFHNSFMKQPFPFTH